MEIILYPFKDVIFDTTSTLLLDASFLLSLVYDNDPKHSESILILRQLLIGKSQLYVTNMISAEVLNQIIYRMFIGDIRYKVDKSKPFNSIDNIKIIISSFGKHDRKTIKEKKEDKFYYIPFKKYFDNLCKNSMKRDLLSVYFKTAVKMHTQLEEALNLRYLTIDENCVIRAKELMEKSLLSVNDACHLAALEKNDIKYLLTLDGDFIYAEESYVNILKI